MCLGCFWVDRFVGFWFNLIVSLLGCIVFDSENVKEICVLLFLNFKFECSKRKSGSKKSDSRVHCEPAATMPKSKPKSELI